jgi:outer membrane immunogenic protein
MRATSEIGGLPMVHAALFILALVAGLAAGPAHATDDGWKTIDQPLEPIGRETTWSGFYIGGNVGGVFDNADVSIRDLGPLQDLTGASTESSDNVIGGVHVGYVMKGASILWGFEADATFSDTVSFLGSLRGKLGFAGEYAAVYGTGGVAYVSADTDFTVTSASLGTFPFTHSYDEFGFVVGGGVDFRVLPNVSLGVEGLYYGLGNSSDNFVAGTEPFSAHHHPDLTVVRGRFTYHFNTEY